MDLDCVVFDQAVREAVPDFLGLHVDQAVVVPEELPEHVRGAGILDTFGDVDAGQVGKYRRRLVEVRIQGHLLLLHLLAGEEGLDLRADRRHLNRLGHEVVHAGGEELLLGSGDGVGGQGDDGNSLHVVRIPLPDIFRALDPVHFRHHVVHENNIIAAVGNHLQGFLPACRGVDCHLQRRQEAPGHLQIHVVVIDDENLCLGRDEVDGFRGKIPLSRSPRSWGFSG